MAARTKKTTQRRRPPRLDRIDAKQIALARELFPTLLSRAMSKAIMRGPRPEIRKRAYEASVASLLAAKVFMKTLRTWEEREKEEPDWRRGR